VTWGGLKTLTNIVILGLVFLSSAQHAYAQTNCAPSRHAEVPSVAERPYAQVRQTLLNNGWQPISFRYEQMHDPSFTGQTKAMVDYGWTETRHCAGTGVAPCALFLSDVYGNVLKVTTEGEFLPNKERLTRFPRVRSMKFVCTVQ
jgi:hypothetical protein